MGKKLVVKIATSKVIASLEKALVKLEADWLLSQENDDKFQKAKEQWQQGLASVALKHVEKADRLSVNQRYDGTINVEFYLPAGAIKVPKEPNRNDYPTTMYQHTYNQERSEIENALRMLKMTDDEFVSASTLGAISQYL